MVGSYFYADRAAAVHLLRFLDGVAIYVFISHEAARSSEVHSGPPSTCTLTLTRDRSESAPPHEFKGRFSPRLSVRDVH